MQFVLYRCLYYVVDKNVETKCCREALHVGIDCIVE
jgi:hypothetical protein